MHSSRQHPDRFDDHVLDALADRFVEKKIGLALGITFEKYLCCPGRYDRNYAAILAERTRKVRESQGRIIDFNEALRPIKHNVLQTVKER